jgi:hypothetical protein
MDSHKFLNSAKECSKAGFLSVFAQIKRLFPELGKMESRIAIEKYVWEHRDEIEKAYSRIIDYFNACGTSIDTYILIRTFTKEWIMKLWLVMLQYSISSGDKSNSRDALTNFLFQVASKDSLLGLNEIIRQCIVTAIQEEVIKEHVVSELVYHLYLILGILIISAKQKGDSIELQIILYFFLSQLKESNRSFFDFQLKENSLGLIPKKSFNLRYVVLYYVNKLLCKNLIDPVKILLVLKKLLKYKKSITMIVKAIRKVVLAFESLERIPLVEIIEIGFSSCPPEEYATLIKELFKLIGVVSVPKLKLGLIEIVPKFSWTFSGLDQNALAQNMKVILNTMNNLKYFIIITFREYTAIVIYLELLNKVQYNNNEVKEDLIEYSTRLRQIVKNMVSKVIFICNYRTQ